jgi:hypothetical protein
MRVVPTDESRTPLFETVGESETENTQSSKAVIKKIGPDLPLPSIVNATTGPPLPRPLGEGSQRRQSLSVHPIEQDLAKARRLREAAKVLNVEQSEESDEVDAKFVSIPVSLPSNHTEQHDNSKMNELLLEAVVSGSKHQVRIPGHCQSIALSIISHSST